MSLPTYSLRPATPADLTRLLVIHAQAFRPLVETRFDWDPDTQLQVVIEGLTGSEMIEVEGEAVGQLIVEDQGDVVFLNRIMLAREWHGRGLGGRVVADLIERAKPRAVTLSVWENNRARALYERLGFEVTHQEGFRVKMRREPD